MRNLGVVGFRFRLMVWFRVRFKFAVKVMKVLLAESQGGCCA